VEIARNSILVSINNFLLEHSHHAYSHIGFLTIVFVVGVFDKESGYVTQAALEHDILCLRLLNTGITGENYRAHL
jgi:hypothetical protein